MREFINIVENAEYPAPHLKRFHEELADAQRGKPETAMLRAQAALDPYRSGPALGYAMEHVGDLTHRMAQRYCERMHYGREMVDSKVRTGLRILTNPVDRQRMAEIPHLPELDRYADEHARLPVFNEAQYHAREASVTLGRRDFDKSVEHLTALRRMLDDGTYEEKAAEYHPGYPRG